MSDAIADIIEQAKQMHKQEIDDALIKGHSDCGIFTMQSECDKYYQETYGDNSSPKTSDN